jgi:molybdopterin synthase sulfur carrier subunit
MAPQGEDAAVPRAMRVTVRLFARLRDIVGAAELERMVPPGATAQQVWDALAVEHPALQPYAAVSSCAINEDYARFSAPVADGDEVAFLPPVSGG